MRMGFRALALGAGIVMGLSGCASAPHLKNSILKKLGKTEVIYVIPKDEIVDTDPATTRVAHAAKFVTLTYLTGGLFGASSLGAATYFAGNKFPGNMEDRMEAQHKLWVDQHWEDRMRAAVQTAIDSSDLKGAAFVARYESPGMIELPQLAREGGFDTVVTVAPQMQIASEGDHLRMLVNIDVMSFPRVVPEKGCRECDYVHTVDPVGPNHDSQQLEVTQALVAVDGGKTWEEQKEAGHKLHDLTEGDFAMFWLLGDPAPLKTFMDTGFQSLQSQLTLYFGGEAKVPSPLPTLKLVVNP